MRAVRALMVLARSGRVWQWVHGLGTVVWMGLCLPGLTIWRQSVPFVVFISLYAIVLSHLVGFVAAIGTRMADRGDPLGD